MAAVSSRPPIEERFSRPAVMGVVNVTPDSFSDGGAHLDVEAAATVCYGMLDDGAAIIDIGGESTRPGANGISLDDELTRVVPVLEALRGAPVSIDTAKADVARAALERGAELVNDVTALRGDPELAGLVAEAGCYVCLMHMRGEPRTMQAEPRYDDVVSEVKAFLEERLALAVSFGIREELVCLDPGIGFGKTVVHNFELVRRLPEIVAIGRPVMVGISRKSTLARLFDPTATVASDNASVGAAVAAYERGATIFRVHNVKAHVEALRAAQAVYAGP
jgi:dihydropteroate synthase